MFLLFLAYVGGVLTILSPCILPVLPFVFARSDQPFRRSGLPLLAGMAVTFALVASLATVGGGWAVRANQFGRIAALVLFGLALAGASSPVDALAEQLGDARWLLILDNLEQVVQVAGDLGELLARCAGLEIVAGLEESGDLAGYAREIDKMKAAVDRAASAGSANATMSL